VSAVVLAVVLTGFTRTFYLRAYFDVAAIPVHAYAHGTILTAWFAWFCLQTSLVAAGRTDLHRRMGIVGALIGIAVIGVSLLAALELVPRLAAKHGDISSDLGRLTGVVWGNFTLIFIFSCLLGLAIFCRHRPDMHKRLMLLASISILGPALARIARIPALDNIPEEIFTLSALLMLMFALAVFDFVTERRVHRVTAIGAPLIFVCLVIGGLVVPQGEFARNFVESLL
jgi:hypothetical protein